MTECMDMEDTLIMVVGELHLEKFTMYGWKKMIDTIELFIHHSEGTLFLPGKMSCTGQYNE